MMKPLTLLVSVLIGNSTAAVPPLPKDLWEKKLTAELAVLRYECEADIKQFRDSRDGLLRLAQKFEQSDTATLKDVAKQLRIALRQFEEAGADRAARDTLAVLRQSKPDLLQASRTNDQLLTTLQKAVDVLTSDPRVETLAAKVKRLEPGDAKELGAARRELADVLAPTLRARAMRTLARQSETNAATAAAAEQVSRDPAAKSAAYRQRALVLGDRQKGVIEELVRLDRILASIGDDEGQKILRQISMSAQRVAGLLDQAKIEDECLTSQAEIATALARFATRFKPVDMRPELFANLSREDKQGVLRILGEFENLRNRTARQSDALRRLHADVEKRLLAELDDSDEPKK